MPAAVARGSTRLCDLSPSPSRQLKSGPGLLYLLVAHPPCWTRPPQPCLQFTLFARYKGNKLDFSKAMPPAQVISCCVLIGLVSPQLA